MITLNESDKARFFKKVSTTLTTKGCMEWTASLRDSSKLEYGGFGLNGKVEYAHRVSWVIHNGPIPDGIKVLHECDNPRCVNPKHLFLGTQNDNIKDRDDKGRQNGPFGEQVHTCKLTEEQVLYIRNQYSHGRTQQSLADEFGLTRAMVGYIVRGQAWKHLLSTTANPIF